jgi:signal transduction histidine kinase
VVLLALFVGIVTSLGILRLLRPLSEISTALVRVGAGERGVAVAQTGLSELDALVDRLNAAARSVDDREDAILSRIALVQEMARIVAHEIRNPLQSLELLTSLIASEDDPHERMAIGESIHTEIRTLEQVVNRLLTESAARGALRLRITVQAVAPLVEQVVALRRPQASTQGVRLGAGGLTWSEVPFDLALVKRTIENLVLNALQAVPRHTGEIRVGLVDEPEHLVIQVDDNGPGVPENLVDHIFEPDVSGREGGTGLGLALVKGVIEAHGGTVFCGRSPLGGARFELRIPRKAHAAEA